MESEAPGCIQLEVVVYYTDMLEVGMKERNPITREYMLLEYMLLSGSREITSLISPR
jgi:hypothetical protein